MKKEVYEKIKDDLPENLRKDVEKYGLESFEFEVLDTASSQKELNRKQREYIKKFNSLEPQGYNLTEDLREEDRKPIHMRIIKEEKSSGSTRESLKFFQEHYQELGEVKYIVLYNAEREWLINPELYHQYCIVIGEKVQLWMVGLTWGYYGEGASGLHNVLQIIDPKFTYDQVISLDRKSKEPITLENVNGRLILRIFDESVSSLLRGEDYHLPWIKI